MSAYSFLKGRVSGLVQGVKGVFRNQPLAGPDTDPFVWLTAMKALPNPDPILRSMGEADTVYASILADAHVMGEVRSVRGSFRSHDYRIVAGDEDEAQSQAAAELCTQWMASTPPNPVADWLEVMWQMAAAIFTGYRVHEVVWDVVGGKWLPVLVVDRASRRFRFDLNAQPLLISRGNMLGDPVPPECFVISRHMPTAGNPYGLALLSSCFWPWTFKTGGWQYFYKFCERHGLPWPIGRYPQGTNDHDINLLGQALETMLNSGYAAVQEGNGVELLVPNYSGGGALPQERLIQLCNREMSKALTSQAMIGEQLDVGAKAAAETAKDRQAEVHDSDRDIAAAGMNQIFASITKFNFGEDVSPPKLEFFKKSVAGLERAQVYRIVADMGAMPSRTAMLEELDIPQAEDPTDALQPRKTPGADALNGGAVKVPEQAPDANADYARGLQTLQWGAVPGYRFAKEAGLTEDDAITLAAGAADQIIEDTMIQPVAAMLASFEAEGKTLHEFRDALVDLVGNVNDQDLRELVEISLTYSALRGLVGDDD